ncbi:MAG: hypothetical protein A2252_08725 [Elusimicrobia bacterium RIFOXYA2_FULL_39_19]|nr:MAG: hypothetical protein A2252_08725 [Elusimicrobia bacterium RIFOXYA2_FULL_39_19]
MNKKIAFFCGIPVYAKVNEAILIRPIFRRVGLLAKALKAKGFEVKIFAPTYEKPAVNTTIEGIEVISVGYTNLPYSPALAGNPSVIRYLLSIFASLKSTQKEIKVFAPDVIHVFTTFPYSIITGLYLKLCGHRVFIDIDDAINGQMESNNVNPLIVALQKFADYRLSRLFSGITVCSEFLKNKTSKKAVILPNMVGAEMYVYENRPAKSAGPVTVAMIGSVDGIQGHADIIKFVIPLTLRYCPNLEFVFAGEGKLLDKMKALAKDYGCENKVKFLGYINYKEVIEFLKKADIGLVPLNSSTVNLARCPLKMLEYQAAGVAVVATDVGEARRLNRNMVTACLMPEEDYERFAESILLLAQNEILRKEIAHNAYKQIKFFKADTAVTDWLKYWGIA